jgi:hypothetical protein
MCTRTSAGPTTLFGTFSGKERKLLSFYLPYCFFTQDKTDLFKGFGEFIKDRMKTSIERAASNVVLAMG